MGCADPVNRAARLLRALNCDAAYGRSLLAACALLVLITLTGETGRVLLRYDRVALADGELWRLITAHLVHELRRRKARFGLGSACIGGGQGIAVLVEAL